VRIRFGCRLDSRIYGSHRNLLLQYHVYMSAKRNLSESVKLQGDVMVNTKTEKHMVHLFGLYLHDDIAISILSSILHPVSLM